MFSTLPRLAALLGARIEKVTEDGIRRLVDHRAAEDVDLDFKRLPHTDGEDLAADVSAMANTRGGVLVIGVEEDDGSAKDLVPLPLTDETTNRMKQMLAEYVAPYVATEIRRVPKRDDPTTGYYLIVVPRSPDAPHAVASRRKGTLRYYQRDGARNRPLPEAEVADAYRQRFRGERTQIERLSDVIRTGLRSLAVTRETTWLVLAAVPSSQGNMPISGAQMLELEAWARDYAQHRGDGPFGQWPAQVTTGVGRARLTSQLDDRGYAQHAHAEIHRDGSGFAASEVINAEKRDFGILGDELLMQAAGLLRLVVEHAVANAGTGGTAVARCELAFPDGRATALGYLHIAPLFRPYAKTRVLVEAPQVETHTIDLDAASGSAVERLATTRVLLTDLVQAFGLPEVLHVTQDGCFNTRYWQADILRAWRSMAGVPVLEREIRY